MLDSFFSKGFTASKWCHLKQPSPSLLQKFINSLPYAARLWTLLAVSSFWKMFAGILSVKEILGSKHKQGLVQKYASSYFLSSTFQTRHGVLLEFCRHDLCFGGKEVDCGHLRLVLPIANLVSYCEASWKKVFISQESCPDFMGGINQKNNLCCGGRSYVQLIRRVLHSEEIGVVVLGTLKVCLHIKTIQLQMDSSSHEKLKTCMEELGIQRNRSPVDKESQSFDKELEDVEVSLLWLEELPQERHVSRSSSVSKSVLLSRGH